MKIIITILLILIALPALAQSEEILINWKSNSFVPSFYQGQALPLAHLNLKPLAYNISPFNILSDNLF